MSSIMYWKLSEIAKIRIKLLDRIMAPLYRRRMAIIDEEYDRCEAGYYKLTGKLPQSGVLLDDMDFYKSILR